MSVSLGLGKSLVVAGMQNSKGSSSTSKQSMNQEHDKKFVVVMTNTVTNPRTVMIHSHDTSITDRAMMGSWWSQRSTLEAVSPFDQ